MPNGNFWTEAEERKLWNDYNNRGDISDLEFCKEWKKASGRNLNSVRGKLQAIQRDGLPKHIPQKKEDLGKESASVEYGDDYINIICSSPRIRSKEDALKEFNIDTDEWRVVSCRVGSYEGYRKDRQVSWHVTDGRVTSGDVEDSGKMLVVPLYRVELRLERKTEEIRTRNVIEEMIETARTHAPKYPKIKYPNLDGGCLGEICIPDIHFGRLSWDRESGEDYDVKIAYEAVNKVTQELLSLLSIYKLSKILIPLGSDYFNVNSKDNTTVKGTPQQEDTRWQKTFVLGRKLAIDIIDACSSVAPVDVVVISGNHDEEKTFYMGDAIECWYNNNPNVTIDNHPRSRKFYKFENNLIGFTHGSDVKHDRLPFLMPLEAPELWAQTTTREWHLGHIHTKKGVRYEEDESNGVLLRTLRSIAAPDAWTFNSGFVGSVRAAEAFVWKPEGGIVAQFSATP